MFFRNATVRSSLRITASQSHWSTYSECRLSSSSSARMAFISVYIPYPGSILYSASESLFHLASECTTSALASPRSLIGKLTGRSTPFRSSLIPSPFSTNRGAVTRRSLSSVDKFCWKNSFISFIPCSVCFMSSSGSYITGFITCPILTLNV